MMRIYLLRNQSFKGFLALFLSKIGHLWKKYKDKFLEILNFLVLLSDLYDDRRFSTLIQSGINPIEMAMKIATRI